MQPLSNHNYSARVIHGDYYPHIDGIRAIAVLPVLLFHILAALCPGGFAGVDVFFVISGYLITGGILRDLKNDRFTIRNFYYRRIRRIMPAYFAMIVGVFVTGCALYYATPLVYLGDSVAVSTLFLANVHFWALGLDYFTPDLHSQVLLHLWSLSVEEQFYLLIPLLCAVLWKIRRYLVAPVLTLIAILSLISAIHAVMIGNQNDAFFLLHFRAWELLSGSLLAIIPTVTHKVPDATFRAKKWQSLFAITGLLMVVVTYAFVTSSTPFPGAVALWPVIGTVLLIHYGRSDPVGRLLSWRPFVAVGKISYSLYLWHWPVTVFWRYATYNQLRVYDYLGMFFLSLALGYLSWKFVELPVRTSPAWTMRRSFTFASAGIICLITLGTACTYFKGWPTVLHPRANAWAGSPNPFFEGRVQNVIRRAVTSHQSSRKRKALALLWGWSNGGCNIGAPGNPELFLIGDSHAGTLRYGLDAVLRDRNIACYSINWSSAPLFNMKFHLSQLVLRELDTLPQVSTVILAERWFLYCDSSKYKPENIEAVYTQLEEFSTYVISKGKRLLIVGDVPNHKWALADIAARTNIIAPRKMEPEWLSLQQTEEEYSRMQGYIDTRLEEICKKTGAVFVPLHLALKKNSCYIYFDPKNEKPFPLYTDANHLSSEGSLRAAQFMIPRLFPESVRNSGPE